MTYDVSLKGRTAVVTGAAGLLGREHCRALLTAGADLILLDKDPEALGQLEELLGYEFPDGRLLSVPCSVTDKEGLQACLKVSLRAGMDPNILVNNAAIDSKFVGRQEDKASGAFECLESGQWNAEIEVGLTGSMYCSQVFGGYMANNGGGSILNIASDLSVIAPDQRLYVDVDLDGSLQRRMYKPASYVVVKTALVGLTRYLATYWAASNVRVNALSPGGVQDAQDLAFVSRLVDKIPMGRMAQVNEYHGAVVFLCSDQSSYLTGQNLVVDGGRSVW